MSRLYLGSDFYVPEDAVTQTFVIFGKRGAGKSNTGVVLAEGMFKAHLPFCVLDPVDAWWGLKASFDGKGPGLGVYIFGGPHADLPLEPTAGALMADVLIEHRISMVLCFKGWSGGERSRFVADFAERLLAKNSEPVHIFLEEADAFCPQKPYKGEERMLGAVDRMVRWGRQSGIGCTLITQRSAKVNKDVTTQAETLVAHRTIGPQDRQAIFEWVKYHGTDKDRTEVITTLATLSNGQAWVWSPEWLEVLRKVTFRRRETFDSAATPKAGQKRTVPKALAPVDLEKLRVKMEDSIKRKEQSDPAALQKRVKELERQLAKSAPAGTARIIEKQVPVPALPDGYIEAVANLVEAVDAALAGIGRVKESVRSLPRKAGRVTSTPLVPRVQASPRRPAEPSVGDRAEGNGEAVTPALRKLLDVLAWLKGINLYPATRVQLAALAGYSPKAGGFNNYLGKLRSSGLIDYPDSGRVALTEAGMEIGDPGELPQSPEETQEMVLNRLPAAKAKLLKHLIDVYGESLAREELADLAGYSHKAGGFNNYLGSLHSLGFVTYPKKGEVKAAPVLFLEEE